MAEQSEAQQVIAALRGALEKLAESQDSAQGDIADIEDAASDLEMVLFRLEKMQIETRGLDKIQEVLEVARDISLAFGHLATLVSEVEGLVDALEVALEE
jgi:hypothetical protein